MCTKSLFLFPKLPNRAKFAYNSCNLTFASAHHILEKYCICSVLLPGSLHRTDCSTAEIPSDKFLHFAIDCCLLEVRAVRRGVFDGEAGKHFRGPFVWNLADTFAKGNAADSCLSSILIYICSMNCEFWEQRFNRHFAKAPA